MPEGPSIQRWSNIAKQFIGRKIQSVEGNSQVIDKEALVGCVFASVQPYGKQMFLEFKPSPPGKITPPGKTLTPGTTASSVDTAPPGEITTPGKIVPPGKTAPPGTTPQVSPGTETNNHSKASDGSVWLRYHFLMWGTLRANELKGPSRLSKTQKPPTPRLLIKFTETEFLVFYNGSVQYVDEPCDDTATDILKPNFDLDKAVTSVRSKRAVSYTLLDQSVFAGLGNIMKNEALYTARIHPLELGTDLSYTQASQLVQAAIDFSAMWAEHERNREFKKTWETLTSKCQVYQKHVCPEGHKTKRDWFGDGLKRLTIWCPECQPLRGEGVKDGKAIQPDGSLKISKSKGSKKTLNSDSKTKSNKGRKRKNDDGDQEKEEVKRRKRSSSSVSKKKREDFLNHGLTGEESNLSRQSHKTRNRTKAYDKPVNKSQSKTHSTQSKTQNDTPNKTNNTNQSKPQNSTTKKTMKSTHNSTQSKTKNSTQSKTRDNTKSETQSSSETKTQNSTPTTSENSSQSKRCYITRSKTQESSQGTQTSKLPSRTRIRNKVNNDKSKNQKSDSKCQGQKRKSESCNSQKSNKRLKVDVDIVGTVLIL